MTAAKRVKKAGTTRMPSFGEALPYAAGGVGLAALENKYIAPDMPEQLKKVNLGLGGITGYLLTSPDPKVRFAALASVPTKQLGIFGIGALDKLRRQQQSLVDANLGVANVNRSTAEIQHANAAAAGRRALLFLIPALAAGAGVGYMGYEKWKKRKSAIPRYQTTAERGTRHGGQRVRIDIPATAMPASFYDSLTHADDSPRALTRFQQLQDQATSKEAAAVLIKLAYSDDKFSLPRMLGDIAVESTGVPGALRTAKDIGMGMSAFSNDRPGEAARYGAGALGNAALTALALKTGVLPLAGKALGSRITTRFPLLAKHVYPWAFGNEIGSRVSAGSGAFSRVPGGPGVGGFPATPITAAQRLMSRRTQGLSTASPMRRLLNIKGRFDPHLYSWKNPKSINPIFNQLFTFRPPGGGGPSTIPGHIYNAARFGGNKLWNLGYAGKQLAKRHPLITLMALGLPIAGLGTQRDETRDAEARKSLAGWVPDWKKNTGPMGIPVSAQLSGIMQAITGKDDRSSIRDQMRGANWDPWSSMRAHL